MKYHYFPFRVTCHRPIRTLLHYSRAALDPKSVPRVNHALTLTLEGSVWCVFMPISLFRYSRNFTYSPGSIFQRSRLLAWAPVIRRLDR